MFFLLFVWSGLMEVGWKGYEVWAGFRIRLGCVCFGFGIRLNNKGPFGKY